MNDTGHEEDVLIQSASFSRPTTGIDVPVADCLLPIQPSGHGGLFTATCHGETAAIVRKCA